MYKGVVLHHRVQLSETIRINKNDKKREYKYEYGNTQHEQAGKIKRKSEHNM